MRTITDIRELNQEQEILQFAELSREDKVSEFERHDSPVGPRFLYIYRAVPCSEDAKAIERLESVLVSGSLYLSSPEAFNDPFDCGFAISESTHTELSKSFKRLTEKRRATVPWAERRRIAQGMTTQLTLEPDRQYKLAKMAIEATGVRCFCESATGIPMWTHYANEHRGICIEIDRSRDDSGLMLTAIKVQYDNDFPTMPLFRSAIPENDSVSSEGGVKVVLTRKAECWKYEEEYRIVAPGEAGAILSISANAISRVFVGIRADPSTGRFLAECNGKRQRLKREPFMIEPIAKVKNQYALETPAQSP